MSWFGGKERRRPGWWFGLLRRLYRDSSGLPRGRFGHLLRIPDKMPEATRAIVLRVTTPGFRDAHDDHCLAAIADLEHA